MLGSVAVLDACVLYPASLRDFLMRLATTGLYQPRWTEAIHAEWARNLLANRPELLPEQVARTCRLMNTALPQAQVINYEQYIDQLTLPDADDRHVVAAAIESGAAFLVTFNLKHFPVVSLAPFSINAVHPDAFALELFEAVPDDFVQAIHLHRASLTRPPKTASEYLAALTHAQLPKTSAALSQYIDVI